MPNFSSLAGVEGTEQFLWGGGGCGFQVGTVFDPTKLLLSCFEFSYVGF